MAKEYRVDCVLTEREKALLVALSSNMRPTGVSQEIRGALAKIANTPGDSVYDRAVSMAMYAALDGGAIEIPDFIIPVHSVELPLDDRCTATVNPDGSIEIGCQTIEFEALKRVYEVAKMAKED